MGPHWTYDVFSAYLKKWREETGPTDGRMGQRNSLEKGVRSIGTASLGTEFKGLLWGIHLSIGKLVWNSGKS